MVFLFVIAAFVGYYMCKSQSHDSFEGFAAIDDARQAVRELYNADVDAIRNLSTVATKLQAGGLTHPGTLTVNAGNYHIPIIAASNGEAHIALRSSNNEGINNYLINRGGHFRLHNHGVGDMFGVNRDGHHYVRHLGDHVMHVEGDGEHPYISLGKTGTWGGKKVYMQNVNSNSADPIFRVGVHDKREMMDISLNQGARFKRKDGRVTHLDWEDNKNYIRGDTHHDNSLYVGGNLTAQGMNIVNEINAIKAQLAARFPDNNTVTLGPVYNISGGNDVNSDLSFINKHDGGRSNAIMGRHPYYGQIWKRT